MDTSLLLKIAGIGFIVAVVCQILTKSGRDEQATLVSVAGIIIVILMLTDKLSELFSSIQKVFGL